MLAGAVGQFLASPTDLVKVQMQMEGRRILEGKEPRYRPTLQVETDSQEGIQIRDGMVVYLNTMWIAEGKARQIIAYFIHKQGNPMCFT